MTTLNSSAQSSSRHDPLAPFEVTVEDGIDDILPRLNKQFRIVDECYQMEVRTDAPLRYFQYGAWRLQKYPLGYVRDYGEGKVFYTALGHDNRAFGNTDFQDQLLKGLRYVTNLKDNPADPHRFGRLRSAVQYGQPSRRYDCTDPRL